MHVPTFIDIPLPHMHMPDVCSCQQILSYIGSPTHIGYVRMYMSTFIGISVSMHAYMFLRIPLSPIALIGYIVISFIAMSHPISFGFKILEQDSNARQFASLFIKEKKQVCSLFISLPFLFASLVFCL